MDGLASFMRKGRQKMGDFLDAFRFKLGPYSDDEEEEGSDNNNSSNGAASDPSSPNMVVDDDDEERGSSSGGNNNNNSNNNNSNNNNHNDHDSAEASPSSSTALSDSLAAAAAAAVHIASGETEPGPMLYWGGAGHTRTASGSSRQFSKMKRTVSSPGKSRTPVLSMRKSRSVSDLALQEIISAARKGKHPSSSRRGSISKRPGMQGAGPLTPAGPPGLATPPPSAAPAASKQGEFSSLRKTVLSSGKRIEFADFPNPEHILVSALRSKPAISSDKVAATTTASQVTQQISSTSTSSTNTTNTASNNSPRPSRFSQMLLMHRKLSPNARRISSADDGAIFGFKREAPNRTISTPDTHLRKVSWLMDEPQSPQPNFGSQDGSNFSSPASSSQGMNERARAPSLSRAVSTLSAENVVHLKVLKRSISKSRTFSQPFSEIDPVTGDITLSEAQAQAAARRRFSILLRPPDGNTPPLGSAASTGAMPPGLAIAAAEPALGQPLVSAPINIGGSGRSLVVDIPNNTSQMAAGNDAGPGPNFAAMAGAISPPPGFLTELVEEAKTMKRALGFFDSDMQEDDEEEEEEEEDEDEEDEEEEEEEEEEEDEDVQFGDPSDDTADAPMHDARKRGKIGSGKYSGLYGSAVPSHAMDGDFDEQDIFMSQATASSGQDANASAIGFANLDMMYASRIAGYHAAKPKYLVTEADQPDPIEWEFDTELDTTAASDDEKMQLTLAEKRETVLYAIFVTSVLEDHITWLANEDPTERVLALYEWIVEYAATLELSNTVLLHAVILVEKLHFLNSQLLLTEMDVKGMYITGLLISAKFLDDEVFPNVLWAYKTNGLFDFATFNRMEEDFLALIGWNASIHSHIWSQYENYAKEGQDGFTKLRNPQNNILLDF